MPFGSRIERDSFFQFPSRLSRPAQSPLISRNLVVVFGLERGRWPWTGTQRGERIERPLGLARQAVASGKSERQPQFFEAAERWVGWLHAGPRSLRSTRPRSSRWQRQKQRRDQHPCGELEVRVGPYAAAIPDPLCGAVMIRSRSRDSRCGDRRIASPLLIVTLQFHCPGHSCE